MDLITWKFLILCEAGVVASLACRYIGWTGKLSPGDCWWFGFCSALMLAALMTLP